jgi:hypothetical protein
MAKDDGKDLIDALNDLLDRERRALLAGDLEGLGRLLPQKEAMLHRLSQEAVGDAPFDGLRRRLRRNQVLLDGALEGIRSVADRMAGLRRARGSIDTYDRAGRKHSIKSPERPSVERRA